MRAHSRKIGASIILNALEWYEFSLYVHFTPLFAMLFFPELDFIDSLTQTFMIFAVGFLSRPLGGIFFGHIGDRLGRRVALLMSLTLMAIPTFMIGLLPTYAVIGVAAPLLLLLMRFLQGFPTGGEFPGAICYLIEMAPPNQRGFYGSFSFFGSQVGSILSSLEFLVIKLFMSPESFASWGWRLSFLVGGLLGLSGWYLRKRLAETPAFEEIKEKHHLVGKPLFESLHTHRKALLKAFLLSILPLSGWYLIFVFTPLYFSQILEMSFHSAMLTNVGFLIFSNILMPIVGRLGDRYDMRKLLLISALGTLILAFPFYTFAIQYSLVLALFFHILLILFISAQFALLPAIICTLFPTSVRFTCVAMSYNMCNALFGGVTPLLAFSLIQKTQALIAPAFVLMGVALIGLISQYYITLGRKKDSTPI
ncbi:MAG: MFS transporter [Chlamydiales bacterium]|nr:MFS transporter [Chlamydiales bacterium]